MGSSMYGAWIHQQNYRGATAQHQRCHELEERMHQWVPQWATAGHQWGRGQSMFLSMELFRGQVRHQQATALSMDARMDASTRDCQASMGHGLIHECINGPTAGHQSGTAEEAAVAALSAGQ
eukprot:scaffold196902_cov18-Tisochrysis_lutea.AAC.1